MRLFVTLCGAQGKYDIAGCTRENKTGIVKTGANARTRYKGGSKIIKRVLNAPEYLHVIMAQFRDILVCLWKVRD